MAVHRSPIRRARKPALPSLEELAADPCTTIGAFLWPHGWACPRRYRPSADRPTTGLVGRERDVVRIAKSQSLWHACVRAGWDPEDLGQEVLLRAVNRARNGKPYDPSRSSLGHYLHVLTSSIMSNLLRQATRRSVEAVVEDTTRWDPAAPDDQVGDAVALEDLLADAVVAGRLPPSAVAVARALVEGRTHREVAAELGLDRAEVARVVEALREELG